MWPETNAANFIVNEGSGWWGREQNCVDDIDVLYFFAKPEAILSSSLSVAETLAIG